MSKIEQPESWRIRRQSLKRRWYIPFVFVEWLCEKLSFFFGQLAFFEILEYLGRLAVLVAIIFWWTERGDRLKAKHYQAWQVINTAQGKPGDGGRTDALRDLYNDGISLANIDLSLATIPGISLKNAHLVQANFSGANLENANLSGADLGSANLSGAILRQVNLSGAYLSDANLSGADLFHANLSGVDALLANFSGANLSEANLSGTNIEEANFSGAYLCLANLSDANLYKANLSEADLYRTDINGIKNYRTIIDINNANIYGVKNAPDGFIEWAKEHGVLSIENRDEWKRMLKQGEHDKK